MSWAPQQSFKIDSLMKAGNDNDWQRHARQLDGVDGVTDAVSKLNEGLVTCSEGFCIVFNDDQRAKGPKGHYVLYRSDANAEAHRAFGLVWESMSDAQLQVSIGKGLALKGVTDIESAIKQLGESADKKAQVYVSVNKRWELSFPNPMDAKTQLEQLRDGAKLDQIVLQAEKVPHGKVGRKVPAGSNGFKILGALVVFVLLGLLAWWFFRRGPGAAWINPTDATGAANATQPAVFAASAGADAGQGHMPALGLVALAMASFSAFAAAGRRKERQSEGNALLEPLVLAESFPEP